LTRARTDGITGPVRVESTGLRAAFTATRSRGSRRRHLAARRPRCRGRSPLERSAAAACWPDTCAPLAACLRADTVTASNTAVAARPSASENGRIGMAIISSVVSLPRGGKASALSAARRSSLREFFPRDRGQLTVDSPRPGCGRPGEEFHVEPSRRIEPRAAGNPRSAGGPWSTRAMDPRRSRQAFHVEPDGIGRGYPQTGSTE